MFRGGSKVRRGAPWPPAYLTPDTRRLVTSPSATPLAGPWSRSLYGWWVADDLGLSDADPVLEWPARVGSYQLTAGTNAPLFRASALNGRATVDFSNAGHTALTLTPEFTTSGEFTWLLTGLAYTSPTSLVQLFDRTPGSPTAQVYFAYASSWGRCTSVVLTKVASGASDTLTEDFADGRSYNNTGSASWFPFVLFIGRSADTIFFTQQDGSMFLNGCTATVAPSDTYTFCNLPGDTAAPVNLQLAEVCLFAGRPLSFDAPFSDAARLFEEYLAPRYNLAPRGLVYVDYARFADGRAADNALYPAWVANLSAPVSGSSVGMPYRAHYLTYFPLTELSPGDALNGANVGRRRYAPFVARSSA